MELFRKRIEGASASLLDWLIRLPRRQKLAIILLADAVILATSMIFAYFLRLGHWQFFSDSFLLALAIAAAIAFPVFFWRGVYRSIIRYSGRGTVLDLAKAIAIYSLAMVVILVLVALPPIPRTIAFIHPLVFFLMLVGSRMAARFMLVDMVGGFGPSRNQRRVIIYGAGAAGLQLAQSFRQENGLRVCAFVDDDVRLDGQKLDGIPVYNSRFIADIIPKYNVSDIFLAMPSITRRRRSKIVSGLQQLPVKVMTLPNLKSLVEGHLSLQDLREIKIEDLLGRDPVPPNELLLAKAIVDQTVLVTGAGGSIGSELCRQILMSRPTRLVLAEMNEFALYAIDAELQEMAFSSDIQKPLIVCELANLADRNSVSRLMKRWRPDTVFHAAAYKHVPLVEANIVESAKNNIFATANCVAEAEAVGVSRFILISTDKAVRPTNIMGMTKRACELILQAQAASGSDTRYAMVRFGNVLGSSGSVVPKFRKQIRNGGPITLTHPDITRYFMTIPEAAQLVLQAGGMARGGEVYVLDMGEPVKIKELALAMIQLSGLTERSAEHPEGDIEIAYTGLRPGEKLYEELLIEESAQKTLHPAIMRADERMIPQSELLEILARLESAVLDDNAALVKSSLIELVPEYTPPEIGQAAG